MFLLDKWFCFQSIIFHVYILFREVLHDNSFSHILKAEPVASYYKQLQAKHSMESTLKKLLWIPPSFTLIQDILEDSIYSVIHDIFELAPRNSTFLLRNLKRISSIFQQMSRNEGKYIYQIIPHRAWMLYKTVDLYFIIVRMC